MRHIRLHREHYIHFNRRLMGVAVSFRFWFILLIVLLFVWGLYADFSMEVARFFADGHIDGVESAGAWGDTFGAFNGLVSLAGAVFVVRTLLLQQSALAEQQKALAAQAADAHRQRFEATFFELLKLLRELRSELRFNHSLAYVNAGKTPSMQTQRRLERNGTDALSGFIRELLIDIQTRVENALIADRIDIAGSFDRIMTNATERTFAPYFRLIYTMLNRLRHDVVLTDVEKNNYARLLRSQLTNTELVAIAYNALTTRSADLETLLTQYRMLKYMPDSTGRTRLEKIFDPLAFAPRD